MYRVVMHTWGNAEATPKRVTAAARKKEVFIVFGLGLDLKRSIEESSSGGRIKYRE
jgi:hypothetical protein